MFDFIKKYWKDILLILLVGVIIILIMSTTCSSRKLSVANNNIKALTDTIRTYELRNGELLSAKQALILERDELSEYLEISNKEKKEIEKKLNSTISYLTKVESIIKIDTLLMRDSVYFENNVTRVDFKYSDTWVQIDGTTKVRNDSTAITSIEKLNVYTPLKVGITEDNQFFITTANPYLTITSIDGAKINTQKDKPKRWNIGVQAGLGLQYGLVNKQIDIGPYIGIGFSYGFSF